MSSSTKGARHPAKPSAPEARTVDKEGLTLQLQSPHGRDTEQRHTLLLKSTLVASVILQQATAALPMFSGCSQKDRVKAARNRLYHLQAEGGQKSSQPGSRGIVFVSALLLPKLQMAISEDRRLGR